jgi:Tol biopolymer transport system component
MGVAGHGGSGGTTSATGCSFGDFSTPELIVGLGRSDALYGPSLSGDGLTLAFSESVAEGPEDIYFAARSDVAAAFGAALPANGINTDDSEGTAFLSGDALVLYFFSDRSGGPGGRDLYRATRSDVLDDFAQVSLVQGISGGSDDHMPWLSSDERFIYFASNRAANSGSTNLWLAQRNSAQDGFEPPSEVAGVNSDGRDISPSLTADRRVLFFCSDRDGGPGSDDIWMATREDAASEFGAPQPVPIINETSSELNVAVSRDGREIIFSSNRSGGRRLFRSVRSCL